METFVGLLFTILCIVLSIIFFSGRGGRLIIGYNIASDEVKERYIFKRLCRVAGGFTTALAIIIGVCTSYHFYPPAILHVIIPLATVFICVAALVLAVTVCRKKNR